MRPAIVVVDMLKDAFKGKRSSPEEYLRIVPTIKGLLDRARDLSIPIIFACDSFLEGDFIFRGSTKQYSLRGTEGAEVIDELEPSGNDQVLAKRRFSAFFKTDLDQTLRLLGVDTVVITGINTHVCVFSTAMDSVCNDFNTIVLEDCSACRNREVHEMGIELLRQSRLDPVLKVMDSENFLNEAANRST